MVFGAFKLDFVFSKTLPRKKMLGQPKVTLLIGSLTAWTALAGHAEPLADALTAGWFGSSVCEKLRETEEIWVLRCTFPPGVGHEKHYHRRHYGYALSGGSMQITDETGTRKVELVTGSDFVSEGIVWHEVLNVGNSTVQYLIIELK